MALRALSELLLPERELCEWIESRAHNGEDSHHALQLVERFANARVTGSKLRLDVLRKLHD